MVEQLDLDRALGLCFSRVRFLSAPLKDKLRWEGVWEDLRQEMHLAAWEAVELGLSDQETRRLAGQHIYAFLKANGWRRRNGHWKMERPLSLNRAIGDTDDIELQDTVAAPEEDWDGALDARARLENCPPGIKRIACKLERGDPLTPGEKACLLRFREDGRPNSKLAWQWRRYWERRSLGLCVTCGERTEDGFARCAACRERFRAMESRWKRGKGRAWYATLPRGSPGF